MRHVIISVRVISDDPTLENEFGYASHIVTSDMLELAKVPDAVLARFTSTLIAPAQAHFEANVAQRKVGEAHHATS